MTQRSKDLINAVKSAFQATFSYSANAILQAPGRVNLIGEHTDYNDGFVLPCAIDYQTIAAASARDDNIVRVVAVDYQMQVNEFDISQPLSFDHDIMWVNYIKGVIQCLQKRGYQFKGADIAISGNVPQGAGLSSSAALEVVIGQTFKTLYNLPITQQDIALNGQQAENQFVGCNCGIMDQLISAKGEHKHALLIDCRTLQTTAVSMPADLSVVIINSNKKRGLVDSEYNTRRQQCEEAARFFNIKALRDIDIDTFNANNAGLDKTVSQRAKHVISENLRTEQAALALKNNDIEMLAELMQASHISMRDDFAITCPEIDILVDIVKEVVGDLGGVRMTGGGFGGCVVAIMPPALVDAVTQAVSDQYAAKTGLTESIYICKAVSGASQITSAGES